MMIICVTHLYSPTIAATSTQSPATTFLSHLSDLYPTEPQTPFYLDHRLFVSTASLLPNSDNKRTYTHLFTSSHAPQNTFIGTTIPSSTNLQTITVPTTPSLDAFTSLLQQKLQPQWAPRQFTLLEHGASTAVPLTDDASWRLSVGNLKTVTNASRATNPASGQNRGIVIEIQYSDDSSEADPGPLKDEEVKKYEKLFTSLLKGLFGKVSTRFDLKIDDAKLHVIQLATTKANIDTDVKDLQTTDDKAPQQTNDATANLKIAELYMDVLRGSR